MADPPGLRTSTSRVGDELRHAILEGVLAPGERLRAGALAERFGTSRTPDPRGPARARGARGSSRSSPTAARSCARFDAADALDLYEVRALIEPHAAARAADPDRAPRARAPATSCATARRQRGGATPAAVADQIAFNEEFHRLIVEAAASPRLLAAMRAVAGIPRAFRTAFWASDEQRALSLFCHRELVAALRPGGRRSPRPSCGCTSSARATSCAR